MPGSLAGNHQRLLATGIQVALSSICAKDAETSHPEPPKSSLSKPTMKAPASQPHPYMPPSWAVDDLLQFSDMEPEDKVKELTKVHSLCAYYYIHAHKFVIFFFRFAS